MLWEMLQPLIKWQLTGVDLAGKKLGSKCRTSLPFLQSPPKLLTPKLKRKPVGKNIWWHDPCGSASYDKEQSRAVTVSGRTSRRYLPQELKAKEIRLFFRSDTARRLRSLDWNPGLIFKRLFSFSLYSDSYYHFADKVYDYIYNVFSNHHVSQ